MTTKRKNEIQALLKGIETGNPDSVAVVNEDKYIQHNPQTHEGSLGLADLFRELAKTSPRVNIVRIFEDGDFVFAHTEYDFARSNIGFEIFRFEGPPGQITISPSVSVNITSNSFDVIDQTFPPASAAYYSFEAQMRP